MLELAGARTNVRQVSGLYPAASPILLPGAGHYTFLPTCAPAMAAAMPRLCADNPATSRAAIHRQAIAEARAFFAKALRRP